MKRAASILALSAALLPFTAGMAAGDRGKAPAPRWLEPVPAAARSGLLQALHSLVQAEQTQDWNAVYQMRPFLDRETETEDQFARRWQQMSPGHVLDFEPTRTIPSEFGDLSGDDHVYDIMGCAQVKVAGRTIGQEGSVSAHFDGSDWYVDGIHLMTTDDDKPEPCAFQRGRGLLQARKGR